MITDVIFSLHRPEICYKLDYAMITHDRKQPLAGVQVLIGRTLLSRLEKLAPPHMKGRRKHKLRVEHILALWIESQTSNQKSPSAEQAA